MIITKTVKMRFLADKVHSVLYKTIPVAGEEHPILESVYLMRSFAINMPKEIEVAVITRFEE